MAFVSKNQQDNSGKKNTRGPEEIYVQISHFPFAPFSLTSFLIPQSPALAHASKNSLDFCFVYMCQP